MKTKTTIIVMILFSFLVLEGCNQNIVEDASEESNNYPYLKIIDNYPSGDINYVKLVNYSFENLSIKNGESQTFKLENGMPAGYENINVVVNYDGLHMPISLKVNFQNGKTTVIILKAENEKSFEYSANPILEFYIE